MSQNPNNETKMNSEITVTEVNKANQLQQEGKLEDAIAVYRGLTEKLYQKLGKLLSQLKNWDEAIATYRRVLELNPEAYECHHQLGEAIYQRVMENPETFFSEYNLAEVTYKDYQVFDPELPEVCFLNDQAFLQATAHLDDATYTVEWYRVYLRRSLGEAEKQGCINWLQTPGHSRELGLKLWRETLAEFQTLLRRSFTIVGLEEAVNCYRRALTINPNHYPSYYGLGDALNQQGQRNEAIIIFHKLSMFLAEEGKLHEAVTCFRKTPQRQPSDGEIYEQIWIGLNGLGILNENNPYYPTDISSEPIHHYFSNKNQYKIINLTTLTNTEQSFLEKAGLSVAILQLIRLDQLTLEEIYINSFRADSLQRLSTSPNRIHKGYPPESWGKSIYLQQSILETGYVYCPCPFTGKILRSSDSFSVFPGIFYRFVSRDVFYLLVGEWYGSKLCFYYPRLDIIIVLQPQQEHLNFCYIINVFKAYMVSRWKKVKSYLSQDKKEVAAIMGRVHNPGHYIWNELTALEYLSKNRTLDKIDKFLVGLYEYFYIDDIFPEITSENIIRVPDIHESLYDSILDHNCLAVRPTEYFISQSLANRIYQSSVQKCSADFLQQIEAAKTHFPLLWITLRNYKRKWLSQVEGTINIIKSLSQEFPNLSVVFDAWSLTEREPGHYDSIIATEQECLKEILTQLPPTINIYSTIGCPIYETVVWANAIDLYIAPFGTGMTFVTWIATKPGVAHGNKTYYNAVDNSFSEICREKAIRPSYVSLDHIIDDENNPDPFTRNYDCDWQVIYNELMQILQNLPKRI